MYAVIGITIYQASIFYNATDIGHAVICVVVFQIQLFQIQVEFRFF